jgi:putative transposase
VAVIDSQSVKAAEAVSRPSRGYDAERRSTAANATDSQGLLPVVPVTAANNQDRTTAKMLLTVLHAVQRGVTCVWAGGGYTSRALVGWVKETLRLTLDIVKKIAGRHPSPPLGRRTQFLLDHLARPNVRDYERLTDHSAAFINLSMITTMNRRLTRERRANTT